MRERLIGPKRRFIGVMKRLVGRRIGPLGAMRRRLAVTSRPMRLRGQRGARSPSFITGARRKRKGTSQRKGKRGRDGSREAARSISLMSKLFVGSESVRTAVRFDSLPTHKTDPPQGGALPSTHVPWERASH